MCAIETINRLFAEITRAMWLLALNAYIRVQSKLEPSIAFEFHCEWQNDNMAKNSEDIEDADFFLLRKKLKMCFMCIIKTTLVFKFA